MLFIDYEISVIKRKNVEILQNDVYNNIKEEDYEREKKT